MHPVHRAPHLPLPPPALRGPTGSPQTARWDHRGSSGGMRGKEGGDRRLADGEMQVGTNSLPTQPHPSRTNTKDRPPLPSPKPGGWKDNFSARGGKIGLHHPVGSARGSCRPRVVLPQWGNILLWDPRSLGYWAGIKWPHQMIGDPPPARCPPPSPPHGLGGAQGNRTAHWVPPLVSPFAPIIQTRARGNRTQRVWTPLRENPPVGENQDGPTVM